MVGPNLPFGGLACGLVLGPLPSHQVNAVPFRPRMPPITFMDDDFKGMDYRQDKTMVISVDIDQFTIRKTLVHQGSLVNILYW